MARKHVISKLFVDLTAQAADYTSEELNVSQTDSGSIHIKWANGSTPNIDIIVQARNGSTDSWRNLDFGSTPNISGASGEHELIFNELGFADLRVFFDRASGSADITAAFTWKSKGA